MNCEFNESAFALYLYIQITFTLKQTFQVKFDE